MTNLISVRDGTPKCPPSVRSEVDRSVCELFGRWNLAKMLDVALAHTLLE